MMTKLSCDVLEALKGRTLVTAESCTGGGIGAALTSIPGSSNIYKGGIISYTNDVKAIQLSVDAELLNRVGAVSAEVAVEMAEGARNNLCADVAISVTGLAGPGADDFGNPVGTVYIGYCDADKKYSVHFLFAGDREAIRRQAVEAALTILLKEATEG
ncbi:MAG: CinA family protein [Oscillospiraceae bacterium]|nr:CinA family protein [Oscillospiraceae bacterium]